MSQATQQPLAEQLKDLTLSQQTSTNTPQPMNIDKNQESKKGYWTDEEYRGISFTVKSLGEGSSISMWSEYWYRVQHFDLTTCNVTNAWQIIQDVSEACGRSLVPHVSANCDTVKYYRIAYLNAKQTDQIYYLLKHSLTTLGIVFTISHTFLVDTSQSVPFPNAPETETPTAARRRRRKNRSGRQNRKAETE